MKKFSKEINILVSDALKLTEKYIFESAEIVAKHYSTDERKIEKISDYVIAEVVNQLCDELQNDIMYVDVDEDEIEV